MPFPAELCKESVHFSWTIGRNLEKGGGLVLGGIESRGRQVWTQASKLLRPQKVAQSPARAHSELLKQCCWTISNIFSRFIRGGTSGVMYTITSTEHCETTAYVFPLILKPVIAPSEQNYQSRPQDSGI